MVKIQYDKIFEEQISNSFKNRKNKATEKHDEKIKFLILKNFLQTIRKLELISIF
ncbi:hypothetical protein CFSAN002368_13033 [Clostridium botulinum A1 str. CFSAN002368]|nr:hypothetical protein CFSAN002368_13033 [Clostridium botulinum A1 str. CFSAN002368]